MKSGDFNNRYQLSASIRSFWTGFILVRAQNSVQMWGRKGTHPATSYIWHGHVKKFIPVSIIFKNESAYHGTTVYISMKAASLIQNFTWKVWHGFKSYLNKLPNSILHPKMDELDFSGKYILNGVTSSLTLKTFYALMLQRINIHWLFAVSTDILKYTQSGQNGKELNPVNELSELVTQLDF